MGILRLEKGYRSWGNEMTTEVSPGAAGLERFCSRSKSYVGRAALDAERDAAPKRALATLVVDADGADCRGSEPVLMDGALVGYVTSGGYGWRVGKSLAVGWIAAEACVPGTALEVQILERMRPASVVADPLYDPDNSKLLG